MFWIDDEKMIGDQQQQLDEQIRTDATRRVIMVCVDNYDEFI
jgi:hypothetical protein